ncbi:biofilm formation stimulator Veg [Lihuaxuella thermophila]|uniref:Uncharacterized protein Veg n=1 Tax=Lihuaxuella thermophila TaxID=1173111 RepID=A0A1H8I875_9BACL|nr:Veg family protein [Lihuaxuella thermophila]SEN64365.1 Uncharacterized protein Veg [Lihuaxuella thermophila]
MGKNALSEIKLTLEGYIGHKIRLKANSGRRKTIERTGILEEIYPSVFVVKLDEDQHAFNRVSYSYADVLTESVELTILDGDNQQVPVKYVKTPQ